MPLIPPVEPSSSRSNPVAAPSGRFPCRFSTSAVTRYSPPASTNGDTNTIFPSKLKAMPVIQIDVHRHVSLFDLKGVQLLHIEKTLDLQAIDPHDAHQRVARLDPFSFIAR